MSERHTTTLQHNMNSIAAILLLSAIACTMVNQLLAGALAATIGYALAAASTTARTERHVATALIAAMLGIFVVPLPLLTLAPLEQLALGVWIKGTIFTCTAALVLRLLLTRKAPRGEEEANEVPDPNSVR